MRAACLRSSAVKLPFLSSSAKGAAARALARSFSRACCRRCASSLPSSLDSRFLRLFSRLSRKLICFSLPEECLRRPTHGTINAMADSSIQRLRDLRNGLLRLHKSLLDSERAAYERDVERITTTSQYLN